MFETALQLVDVRLSVSNGHEKAQKTQWSSQRSENQAFCASLRLEENPYPKLYIPWRVVRDQSTKVRVVRLSRAEKFQPLDRPDVKRVGISAGKPLRYASAKETERQGADRLTRGNREPNAVENAIDLGQRSSLTWIRCVPRIDFSLRHRLVAWQ